MNADPELRVTALTVAEIRYGMARLPEGQCKQDITEAANKLLTVFDAQIAAVCQSRSAILATRNAKDFEGTGVTIIDPWNA